MILKDISSIKDHFYERINMRLKEIIDTEFRTEVQQMKELKIGIRYKVIGPTYDLFQTSFLFHRGHITRKWAINQLIRQSNVEGQSSMGCFMRYFVTPDNTIQFDGFDIVTKAFAMDMEILDALMMGNEWFDEMINNMIHHEIGHILDSFRFQGAPVTEYEEYYSKDSKLRDEYYKWLDEEGDDVDPVERMRRYYTLPTESMANTLGGVNLEDLIRQGEHMLSVKNKKVTLEIKVHESEKQPTEKENK